MSLINRIGNFICNAIFFASYFGQWNKEKIIYKIDNCKFKLRVGTSDKVTVWEVFKFKEYIDNEDFKINSSDIVLDIGGNIGAFTVFAAKIAKKVYVYEALKENYILLNENVKLNNLKNVKAFNVAVSDKLGEENFFSGGKNLGGSSLYKQPYFDKMVKVPTITLQKIFSDNNLKRVNFLKMDVEEAEYKILLNTLPSLLKKIDKIRLEFHQNSEQCNYTYHDLKKLLEDNGFKVNVSISLLSRLANIGRLDAKLKSIN